MGGMRITVADAMTYLEKSFLVIIAAIAEVTNKVKSIAIMLIWIYVFCVSILKRSSNLFKREDRDRLFGADRRVSLEAKPLRFWRKGIRSSVPLKSQKEAKKKVSE